MVKGYDNPPDCIHGLSGPCLGDIWSSLNFFYHLSIKSGRVVRISEYAGNHNVRDRIIECLDILSDPGYLEIVTEKPTREKLPFYFSCDYFRTRWVWRKRRKSKLICYQFDAMSGVQEKRRPTEDEIADFKRRAEAGGWVLEDLGGKRPLIECVKLASMAYAYVGVVSGLAEVCTSVGVPMHIAVNEFPWPWIRAMYAGRFGRLYKRLPDIDLENLHDVGMM